MPTTEKSQWESRKTSDICSSPGETTARSRVLWHLRTFLPTIRIACIKWFIKENPLGTPRARKMTRMEKQSICKHANRNWYSQALLSKASTMYTYNTGPELETGGSLGLLANQPRQLVDSRFIESPCFKNKCWRARIRHNVYFYSTHGHTHIHTWMHTNICPHTQEIQYCMISNKIFFKNMDIQENWCKHLSLMLTLKSTHERLLRPLVIRTLACAIAFFCLNYLFFRISYRYCI